MNEGVEKTAVNAPVATTNEAVEKCASPARMSLRELLRDANTTFVPADRLDSLATTITHAHVIIVFRQNSEWFFLRYCSPTAGSTAGSTADEGNVPGGGIEKRTLDSSANTEPNKTMVAMETPEEAITRECSEEIGLAIELNQLQTIGVIENNTTDLVDRLFFVALPDDSHTTIPTKSPEGGIISSQPVSQLLAELDENSPAGLKEAIRAKLQSHEIPIDSLQQ